MFFNKKKKPVTKEEEKKESNKENNKKIEINAITQNIGRIEETEDRIVCYVSQKSICELSSEAYLRMNLFGINHTNKPIYYVFDSLQFPSTFFCANHCHLIFKNCVFYRSIRIEGTSHVTFENGALDHPTSLYFNVDSLSFKDFKCFNCYGSSDISIQTKDFTLSNTEFRYLIDKISIETQKATFENASLISNELKLKADSIQSRESTLHADEIIIDNSSCDLDLDSLTVNSHFFTYNKSRVNYPQKEEISISKELYEKRKKLVFLLSQLQKISVQEINRRVKETKKGLEGQPIRKLNKKKEQK